MASEDKQPHWQFVADFVLQSPYSVTLAQIKEHLIAHGRNPANAQPEATAVSVNENSRVHYGSGKEIRRTDSGNKYDLIYHNQDRSYVPYKPSIHGIWEIYRASDGTRGVRRVDAPSENGEEDSDNVTAMPGCLPSQDEKAMNTFRLESHLRDYLAQNLGLFSLPDTGLALYKSEDGTVRGVEFQTEVGPIDILAVAENGTLYVIELKVSRGADAAVGQVLRYMGAVRKNVAKGKPVFGVIVAAALTEKLKMALSEVKDKVFAVEYELKVSLKQHGHGV